MRILILCFCCFLFRLTYAQPGQMLIPRVELMPSQPAPYDMRDWRTVAIQYDSFIYDIHRTGQYLPLCFINPSGINYPELETFRLHTYVGTNSPFGNEAINVLPSLVGATLVGVNKRDQYGRDWITMSRDFFNKANGEDLYLNAPGARSGQDWWYDLMPNIYFYQLYDLYEAQDAETSQQFVTIANRLAGAVEAMGGRETPWQPAYMNYRAWRFQTMEPNANGVPEPEAAGAFAWLLYHAYKETQQEQYRKAAEWSIEFLDSWTTNPSYELMLPYGILAAAKMNAELGTGYDIEKMVNWSFDRGPLRGWGAIVGTWGGMNVSGLIGEANDGGNDYAFQMNGVQQAAALVPMVRYDKRFARAVGKWVLNMANATRLFYPTYLSSDKQDASAWSAVHDPQNVIGYEAMRQVWQGKSPFATGDAVNGGWAETNLALYGTSSIGYLGAMIAPTNVDKILRLDVLATDFFRDTAYPTYLYYNSYSSPRSVQLQVGGSPVDVYDALTETFVHQDATGIVPLSIPAGQAMLVTLCPAGGTITYDQHRMLVDGVVVDFRQSAQPYTSAPRIKGMGPLQDPVEQGMPTIFIATAEDADTDADSLIYYWTVRDGSIQGTGSEIEYTAPGNPGDDEIQCIVEDQEGNRDTATYFLQVVAEINEAPVIDGIVKDIPYAQPGAMMQLTCVATDPDADPLTYAWSVSAGSIIGSGASVAWSAPGDEGIYSVSVTVTDDGGLIREITSALLVHDFSTASSDIIAHYPFTGNALDISGHDHHGTVSGAQLTSDRLGQPQQAYAFFGGAQHISVPNDPQLNVQDAISVAAWFRPEDLPEKESFIVSHGSWQNRWKLSITPDRQLRWTVNTTAAIGDLDGLLPLRTDSFYHVVVTFGDDLMTLHVNGQLQSFRQLTGSIRTTSVPLLIGQMLPGETGYNFNGVIDDVQLYQGVLTPEQVRDLYEWGITSVDSPESVRKDEMHVFPNPANDIVYLQAQSPLGQVRVSDIHGRLVYEVNCDDQQTCQVSVGHLAPGMYILTRVYQQQTHIARMIKIQGRG